MWSKRPRRSVASSITGPTKSFGTITDARMYGSSTSSTSLGISAGLCTSTTSPVRFVARYATVGAVMSRSRSNSRSSRSRTISMCSSPRKPQRNPNPSACEVSGS